MTKKNDKRLCWNCDGYVHFHLERCPYCGVDLTKEGNKSPFAAFSEKSSMNEKAFAPPYAATNPAKEFDVSDEEWKAAIDKSESVDENDESNEKPRSNELTALLLLLPGISLFLFAMLLILFSKEGSLHLHWKESFAYFYFLGAVPLLILGWKALNKN
jgi:hypothetical protein